MMSKENEYVAKIYKHLSELFNEDCENFTDLEEVSDGDNATDFAHALGNLVPNIIISNLMDKHHDSLAFNHMMNRLCAQKMNVIK